MTTPPLHAVRCLKEEGSRSVWLIQRPDEPPRVLKRWPLTPGMMLRLLLGISPPQRLQRGIGRATAVGIRTAQIAHRRSISVEKGKAFVHLELEYLPGQTLHEALTERGDQRKIEVKPERRVAREIGEFAASLARSGFVHRDFKAGNLVLSPPDQSGEERVWMIDTDGIQPCSSSEIALERMITSLHRSITRYELDRHCSACDRFIFLSRALRGIGREQRRLLLSRLRRQPRF